MVYSDPADRVWHTTECCDHTTRCFNWEWFQIPQTKSDGQNNDGLLVMYFSCLVRLIWVIQSRPRYCFTLVVPCAWSRWYYRHRIIPLPALFAHVIEYPRETVIIK